MPSVGNLKIQYWPIGKLKPLARNARAHPPDQIDAIKRAIERWGIYAPILVDSKKGHILKGNGTFQAASQLEHRTVPVIEVSGLSQSELRALVVWDNKSAEKSGWDKELLALELGELKDVGFDLTLTGFDAGEIEELLKPSPNGEPEEPVTPALPKNAVSKPGDLWVMGDHRLICGDSTKPAVLKALMGGRRAQCVFTDPPYGVSYGGGKATSRHPKRFEVLEGDERRRGDLVKLLTGAFSAAMEHVSDDAAWYIWHGSVTREDFEVAMKAVGLIEPPNGYIIWVKPPTMGWSAYKSAFEPCFYAHRQGFSPSFHGDRTQTTVWEATAQSDGGPHLDLGGGVILASTSGEIYVGPVPKGKKVRHQNIAPGEKVLISTGSAADNVWRVGRGKEGEETVHPTQKPVELARRALRNSTLEGEAVLDMFAGSSSTLMAAEQTKRCGYAIELDPRYVDQSVRRWQEMTGKQATHGTEKKTFDAITKLRAGLKPKG